MIITITDDFDMKKIEKSGQCFRVKEIDKDLFRFIYKTNVLYIKNTKLNTYEISCPKDEWENVWYNYFDLSRCYNNIRNTISDDDLFLRDASIYGKGIRILKQDPFEMLITFIISQRKSIPAIKSSVEKICKLYGKKIVTPYETVYSFPTIDEFESAPKEKLSECGLGYRLPYILDALDLLFNKKIILSDLYNKDTTYLFNSLKQIKGVGDKVANCICLFAYNRIEMAPVDTWISKIIDSIYNGINPFPNYPQNAGIMQQYMFYYIQMNKTIL